MLFTIKINHFIFLCASVSGCIQTQTKIYIKDNVNKKPNIYNHILEPLKISIFT